MSLDKNKEAELLRQISDISFPFLDQLYIAENLIESIDSLSQLRAPLLQVIWMRTLDLILDDNLICSLKPLKRTNLPHLAYIRASTTFCILQPKTTSSKVVSWVLCKFPSRWIWCWSTTSSDAFNMRIWVLWPSSSAMIKFPMRSSWVNVELGRFSEHASDSPTESD